MIKRAVTIKDLAKKLGVSKSTISRALRDHPNVKEATRVAVQKLAKELNYQPDRLALGLVGHKTYSLGLVVPRIDFPYFSHAVSGAQEIASRAGYQIIICQSNESLETEKAVINTLLANRVDGLMISISIETEEYDHITDLQERGIPFVLFDRVIDCIKAPKVVMDNVDAAFRLVSHLIEQGYRRIAHIAGPRGLLVSEQRIKGYEQALRKYGLEYNPAWVIHSGFRVESGEQTTKQLLELNNRPDAIMAVSDSAAMGAVLAIEDAGLRVPDDIAVAGFNNEHFTRFVKPGLTTVSLPMYELGQQAVKMLLRQIEHPDGFKVPHPLTLKSHLIERGSTTRR
ncbi:MAG: LacI family DNA-binding transcriptional regulator [Bacteroidia bacterium]